MNLTHDNSHIIPAIDAMELTAEGLRQIGEINDHIRRAAMQGVPALFFDKLSKPHRELLIQYGYNLTQEGGDEDYNWMVKWGNKTNAG